MKKKITVGTSLILVLLAVLLTFQITYSFVGKEYQAKVETLTKTQSDFSLLAQVDSLIRENFIGSFDDDSVENGLALGYISALSDSYSKYLSPDEYLRYQKERAPSGSGIGLRLTYDTQTKKIYVCDVIADSPAHNAGILVGDEVVMVNGKECAELGFYGTLSAISAEEGTEISLAVKRKMAAQILDMSFSMKTGLVTTRFTSFEWLENKIGYLKIFSFDSGCEIELQETMETLSHSNAKGVIFDVRNTSGGSADVASLMLDLLLPEGILFHETNEKGETSEVKSDKESFDLPMTVLVNGNTSFAAELFAVALKDYDAATIIGEKTFGKSMGQKIFELDNKGALLLSNITYTPPVSPSFEKVGVEPDIVLKQNAENLYLIEKNDDVQIMEAYGVLNR